MDARLTGEQAQLRDAAAKLATDLGPESVAAPRLGRSPRQAGHRTRTLGVADAAVRRGIGCRGRRRCRRTRPRPRRRTVPRADPRRRPASPRLGHRGGVTVAVGGTAVDARGIDRVATSTAPPCGSVPPVDPLPCADLTREAKEVAGSGGDSVGTIPDADGRRWYALALVATAADLLGAARSAHALACDYAKIREQYGEDHRLLSSRGASAGRGLA